MPSFADIYTHYAAEYDQLVSCEDYQRQLLPALQNITPLQDKIVVEMGAGTGRLTRLLALYARRIYACDGFAPMLHQAAQSLSAHPHLHFAVADNRALPLPSAVAQVCVQGWSFGHAVGWYPNDWRTHIDAMVGEALRVLQPHGTAIMIETLGTGQTEPAPPIAALAEYYAYLETQHGFSRTAIRTDYLFDSVQEGEMLLRFFFGDAMAEAFVARDSRVWPECTGIWWRVR
jgi:ubiquinone/menaquinone biosynthesis C-methylase UbiE